MPEITEFKPKLSVPRIFVFEKNYQLVESFLNVQEKIKLSPIQPVLIHEEIIAIEVFKDRKKGKNEVRAILEKMRKDGFIEKVTTGIYSGKRESFFLNIPFRTIYDWEYRAIVESGLKNRQALLKHFICLVNSFNDSIEINSRTGVIGYMPVSYFVKKEEKNESTICALNKSLEKLGLIYIYRTGQTNDGKYKNNIYCRKEDAEYAHQYAREKFKGNNIVRKKNTADINRSITQKYNHFVRTGGKGYSYEDILRLYYQCESYNDDMEMMALEDSFRDYKSRIKDLSVFKMDDIFD